MISICCEICGRTLDQRHTHTSVCAWDSILTLALQREAHVMCAQCEHDIMQILSIRARGAADLHKERSEQAWIHESQARHYPEGEKA